MASGVLARPFALPAPGVLLFEILIGSAAVGFSEPRSPARLAVLPVVATCVYEIVTNASSQMRIRWAALVGGLSFTFLLQYLDVGLLSRWNYAGRGPGRKPLVETVKADRPDDEPVSSAKESFWDRLSFGWDTMLSFRHVNTPYQVRNVPPFSSKNPDYAPSRSTFVIQRIAAAAVCFLVLDLLGSRPAPPNNAELFDRRLIPFFSRLGEVTSSQVKLRAFSIAGFGVTFYCVIQGFYSALSALVVGLGLSEPRDWRPTFGSVLDSYSLRNFWGKFWHQSLRQLITSPATWLAHDVLQLHPGSFVERLTTVTLSFAVSGIMHSASGVSSGMSPYETGVFQFFCTQALGYVIEASVQKAYSRWKGQETTASPSVFERCVGYVWVAAFMTWSGPVWIYPQAARSGPGGPGSFLPFSIVKAIRS